MSARNEVEAETRARARSESRELNDWIESLAAIEGSVGLGEQDDIVCECGSHGCGQRITISHAEYGELRTDPTLFAVFPDTSHVLPDVDQVVVRNDRFWIVRKRGG